MRETKSTLSKVFLWLVAAVVFSVPVYAQASSTNYRVEESFFGTGGEVDTTSPTYRAQQSAGGTGVGLTSSNNFDAEAGFLTPGEPYLEMSVSSATVDFGTLSDTSSSSGAAQAGTCNCSFYVRSYRSSAYSVVTMSQPPTSESGAVLAAKTTQGSPSVNPSVEEFGINLVANTSPAIGANPTNQPDNTFADGKAATGYNVANQFKYNVGDTIAQSPATVGNQAVGQTNYTISYIAKRKTLTSAGLYTMRHDIVVVATY